MLPRLALTLAVAVVVCVPARAVAQSQPELEMAAPAHVSHVEGTAVLEREGRAENSPLNMPLLSGDRLKTSDGRVEVLFADGAALHLDNLTTVDFQSDDLARLIEGRMRLNIPGPARSVAYRIDSPAGSVRIRQPGEYRIALVRGERETQLELAVLRGAGEVFTDLGATPVRAGERAYASAGLAPSYAYSYNSANWDAFDRWSETRRDVRMGVSAQYLPSDMRTYAATFDDNGDWRYDQSYGQVWYPRVAADWRPYYRGRWASYPRYGWTWIGADRFAWPTHHYGRWGFSAGAWFWIPGDRWAPAYVSWGYAPGYVSWCPLGLDNRPVIAINIFNDGGGYNSVRGWTSVSRGHFGRDYVHHRAVSWDRVDRGRRPDFRSARSAPVAADYAVPRGSTGAFGAPNNLEGRHSVPIQRVGSNSGNRGADRGAPSAGSTPSRASSWPPPSDGRDVAVPRGTAPPRYVNRGDEIVRSQTARPIAPRAAAPSVDDARTRPGVDRGPAGAAGPAGFTRSRTAPEGVARRVESARDDPSPTVAPMPSASPSPPRAPADRYRQPGYSRPDFGGYRTRPGAADPAPRPRETAPDAPSRVERREPAPAPQPYAQPRGYDPRPPAPVPSRAERPERAAPAPQPDRPAARERSAPAQGPGLAPPTFDRAVPRSGGAPRPRGGR